LLLLLAVGCSRQDTETLTRLGTKLQGRAEALAGDLKSQAGHSWHGGDFGTDARVAARLRWDKQLADQPIDVVPLGQGVELRGRVRTLELHRRAVMLAETTSGVDAVKDSLQDEER
jgi:hypothetical protein